MASEQSHAARLLVDAFERVAEQVPEIVDGLDEEALRWRVDAEANSIAWLVWHLSRVQDDHVAGVAAALEQPDADQVWIAGGWARRFALPFDDAAIGYGHTSDEVAAVRAPGDLLAGYHAAVHEMTRAVIHRMDDADYDAVVDRAWTPEVTASVRLVSVVNDATQHAGQAAFVRGLWERRV